MKKLSLILLALLAIACEEEKNPEPIDSIEFKSTKAFSFDNKGGDKTISFTASGEWTSSTSAGSVIVLKEGFQYRPEGWTSLRTNNSGTDRPGNTTAGIVVVDDSWWGSWNYRAFNLAKAGNPNLTDAEQETLESCFAIFKPKQ